MLTDRFADALAFAERLHRTQKRKGNEVPYVAHLLAVAATVLEWGGDEDTAIAALLHDAVEDQGGLRTAEMIRKWYGARVVELVLHCTDSVTDETEDKLPWLDRKTAYIERLRRADAAVALITAADNRYVATSVSRRIIARMQATHERRRISVFSGPPGIGKTTAIDQWRRGRPEAVAVVKIGRQNAKEAMTLQHTLEAVRRLTGEPFTYVPTSIWELRKDLFGAICRWADADPLAARKGEYDPAGFGRLTIVFDEAQNLSRQAIEALRYWNDSDRCYAPFPVGLVFVGNSEFSLAGGADGSSVISAAVADRALYIQSLEYDELTDDDISLVVQDRGIEQYSAVAEIIRAFKGPRAVRSLRRVLDIVDDAMSIAAGGPITQDAVRSALNYA